MTLTQYYVAATVDGLIADEEDSLDWLFTARSEEGGPPNYAEFISAVGAIAMGSTTYEWILRHSAATSGDSTPVTWPYDLPCWVFTHRDLPRASSKSSIVFTSDDVRSVHAEMTAAAGDRNVWMMGGGDLAGQFADAGLLDELILAIAPTTLGAGAPLLPRRLPLRLEDVRRSLDFTCIRYTVVR
ncbi:MAG: dihydrofolate reductase family protein [Acidimicrobiales bacterium]